MKNFSFILLLLVAFTLSARSVPYYDGSNASHFSTVFSYEGSEMDRIDYAELSYDEKAHALDYRYRAREDGLVRALRYDCPGGITAAERLVFRVRNLGSTQIDFSGSWNTSREGDAPGTSRYFGWNFPWGHLPPDGEWHEISLDFRTPGAHDPVNFPDPIFRPFGFFVLHLNPVPAGVEMHLQIAQIRGEDDTPCTGAVQWDEELPAELSAGDTLRFPGATVTFTGRDPLDRTNARLIFRNLADDEAPEIPFEISSVQRADGRWRLEPSEIPFSRFLNSGDYRVRLECGEAELENAERTIHLRGRENVSFALMETKQWGGRPTMWKDGAPMAGAMRATYTTEGPAGIRAFSEAGVRIFGFCGTPTEGGYTLQTLVETAQGQYDYRQFDRRMRNVLDVNPDAMVVVRLYLSAPLWWSQQHPEDVDYVGRPHDPTGKTEPFRWWGGRPVPSWCSRAWRDYTVEGLKHLVDFLKRTPYADHIAGFVLASGHTEEWMEWGLFDDRIGDYSPVALKAFRSWLTAKYGTDEALRTAWGDETSALATATLPTPFERYAAKYSGYLPTTAPGARRIADYRRFHSEAVAGCIAEFAHAVKQSTENRLLVGAFYGYFLELCGTPRLADSGHLGVGRLLSCPDLDFLCSPESYFTRGTGGSGMPRTMGAADSLQLHGKFWFMENDMRTNATAPGTGLGRPDTPEGDVLQQTKVSFHNLLSGMAQWWFDVGYIPFSSPILMRSIREIAGVMDEVTLHASRKSVAQVALLLDESSSDWLTENSSSQTSAIQGTQLMLKSLGAPYEVYLTDDLPILPERLRVIILPMSLQWTPEQKAAIEHLERDGRVVVFLGTPGAVPQKPNQTLDESATEFTGLPLVYRRSAKTLSNVVLTPDGDWLTLEYAGAPVTVTPWMASDTEFLYASMAIDSSDRTLHALARTDGGKGDCLIGVRETPEASVVLCGTYRMPWELAEAIYRKAGVHRYVESDDQVWASDEVIAICVQNGGSKIVHLRGTFRQVRDLVTGETYPVDAENAFAAPFEPLSTRIFRMEK